jgi:hypothetical protein
MILGHGSYGKIRGMNVLSCTLALEGFSNGCGERLERSLYAAFPGLLRYCCQHRNSHTVRQVERHH